MSPGIWRCPRARSIQITSCGSTSYCQKYLSGTYDIKANAYYNSGITSTTVSSFTSHSTWTSEKLYGKSLAGDEKGLGIASDPTGDGEIYGTHFIQIYVGDALAQGLTTFLFAMGSDTQKEAWSVYGSNTSGNGSTLKLLLTGHDEVTHVLPTGYKYYDFFYNSSLGSLSGQGNNVLQTKRSPAPTRRCLALCRCSSVALVL